MEFLPTEILTYILTFLTLKQLAKCREVCRKWRDIGDYLLLNQDLWKMQCRKDFNSIYVSAYNRRMPGLNWGNVYRSLTLWSKLDEAFESRNELATASSCIDEIQDIHVLKNGIVGVQTRDIIKYYDISTLKPFKRSPILGNYLRYTENDNTVIVLGHNDILFVQRKVNDEQSELHKTFENVKSFLLSENNLIYVTFKDEVYLCDLNEKDLKSDFVTQVDSSIMAISYDNGQLNLLTFQRDIFTIVGKDLMFTYNLDSTTNLLHELNKFNFLENLDWRVYLQWMFLLHHTIPPGPLRDIIIIRTYGDVVFVGSNWGILRIYYAPYHNNEFDLFNSEPIRQYNFIKKYENPTLSMCPIIQINVTEGIDTHIVLVAMPTKIIILTFSHTLKKSRSAELLSYKEV